jgi:hypothetical protein
MAVMLFAGTSNAEILTWDCGAETNEGGVASVVAMLDIETGVMTVSGKGAMANYKNNTVSCRPWHVVRSKIISLVIGDGVTTIGDNAFGSPDTANVAKNLTSITFASSSTLTRIGRNAFLYCKGFKGGLTLPEGLESIGENAFYATSFRGSLTLPSTLKSIGLCAFNQCTGFTGNLTIPEGVIEIDRLAFYRCTGFTGNLTLPSTLKSIGFNAFLGCSGFTGSLTLPSSLTSIGHSAFLYCDGFTEVISLRETPVEITSDVFTNATWASVRTLVVPNDAALAAYRGAAVWRWFGNIVTEKTSVLTRDRVIPALPSADAVVVAPLTVLAAEFTAGPNPVSREAGKAVFFRQGKSVSGTLSVYDASGNVVIRNIQITDKTIGITSRREVGSWDLKDSKGRPVSEGAYLVRGTVKTNDGKSEKVSLVVGVR